MTHKLKTHEVACPLCHGRGYGHKEHLVVRWRSREFEQTLQTIVDEEGRCTIVKSREVVYDDPWDVAVEIFDHHAA